MEAWPHTAKPPHHPFFLFSDIVANPYVVKVTHAVLGDGLFNSFYSGNTNYPGSEQQPIHRDADPLWSEMRVCGIAVCRIGPIKFGT
tara:strand:- start:1869 stop:2129 length:261 start_codon:yes stop_codon:yes gene_type:complete